MQEKKHELFNAELDQLKELFDKDDRSRDENGFPLLENGEIDWEQTSQTHMAIHDTPQSLF